MRKKLWFYDVAQKVLHLTDLIGKWRNKTNLCELHQSIKRCIFFWNSNSLTNKVESGSVQKPPQKLVFLCLFPHFNSEESCILGNRNSIPHCSFKDLDFNMIANVNIQNRNNYRLDLIIHCHCMRQIDDYFNGSNDIYHFLVSQNASYNLYIRACHKSKISLNFFGTCIFSWVCIYINGKFWFWQFFFIIRWVKMPPKGYNEKNIKSLISWSLCIFE